MILETDMDPPAEERPRRQHYRVGAEVQTHLGGNPRNSLLAAELFDVVRSTILFDDAYEMACFYHYMKQEWEMTEVRNLFVNRNPSDGSDRQVPRIHCNCAL